MRNAYFDIMVQVFTSQDITEELNSHPFLNFVPGHRDERYYVLHPEKYNAVILNCFFIFSQDNFLKV
jgi:hypothetical protein